MKFVVLNNVPDAECFSDQQVLWSPLTSEWTWVNLDQGNPPPRQCAVACCIYLLPSEQRALKTRFLIEIPRNEPDSTSRWCFSWHYKASTSPINPNLQERTSIEKLSPVLQCLGDAGLHPGGGPQSRLQSGHQWAKGKPLGSGSSALDAIWEAFDMLPVVSQ